MPKKQYRHTDYAKRAKKKAKSKVLRLTFELNVAQSELAKELDPEVYGATSLHTLAKKLFLQHMNKESPPM